LAGNAGAKVPARQEISPWLSADQDRTVDGTDRADKNEARSMKLRRRPRTYWLGRVLRGRRLDRNPLRRGSDRVETAVLGALLAETAAAGSVATALIMAGWLARRSLDRRRLAAWDADWLANGPHWSPRR
jgi:hypothetical protein